MPHGASYAELRVLENHLLASGYAGVYEKGPSWQVRLPWTKAPLGTWPTPTAAAAALALWWRGEFGPDWPRVYAEKDLPAVEVVPDDERPGWVVFAHAEGVPVEVTPPGGGNWPAESAARKAGEAWLRSELGLLALHHHFARRGHARPLYARRPYPDAAALPAKKTRRTRRQRPRAPSEEGGLFLAPAEEPERRRALAPVAARAGRRVPVAAA